jgi:hypothetical protein
VAGPVARRGVLVGGAGGCQTQAECQCQVSSVYDDFLVRGWHAGCYIVGPNLNLEAPNNRHGYLQARARAWARVVPAGSDGARAGPSARQARAITVTSIPIESDRLSQQLPSVHFIYAFLRGHLPPSPSHGSRPRPRRAEVRVPDAAQGPGHLNEQYSVTSDRPEKERFGPKNATQQVMPRRKASLSRESIVPDINFTDIRVLER